MKKVLFFCLVFYLFKSIFVCINFAYLKLESFWVFILSKMHFLLSNKSIFNGWKEIKNSLEEEFCSRTIFNFLDN